jgi:hypothetical protein
MLRAALLVSILCAVSARGRSGAEEPPLPQAVGCGDCRVTFMKCMVAGKDLPPDERKEHNERCAAVAASCYRGCKDAPVSDPRPPLARVSRLH